MCLIIADKIIILLGLKIMEIFNLIKDIFLEYESLIYPIFLLIFMLIINYISIKDYDYMIVRKEEIKWRMIYVNYIQIKKWMLII